MKLLAPPLTSALILALILPLAAACSGDGPRAPGTAPRIIPPAPSLKPECGVASYYHRSLAGGLTANGETYTPEALTAAHLSLPFDTRVRVKRRDSRESATVRINDRGPFVDGRIIDLSRAAAKEIGIFGEDGIAEVCLVAPRPMGP
ncbi:septal ring lytic transglycosylase RlpA family protein [Hyphococcus sp.]|uniref:septal ring lytic transglycosylase RlpA family protein n=1 Tax=Hyphococcus sp. TaxID=2038636 RepID=UPI003CCC2C48